MQIVEVRVTAKSRGDGCSFRRASQFGAEIAAPDQIEDPITDTGASGSTKECEWKQGDSAVVHSVK